METGVNMLNVNTRIGTLKITIKFMTVLDFDKLPEPKKVDELVNNVFNHGLSLWENARNIRNEFRYCYEVVMTPQLKRLNYNYEIIKK